MIKKNRAPIVAYVGPVPFPNGGAATRRILGNVLTLQNAGFNVIVGSGQMPDIKNEEIYKDISVYSLGERSAEKYPKLLKHLFYFNMGKKTCQWLDSLKHHPDAIILYSGYSPYLMRLLSWCKKHDVPLFFDAVEWYDPPSRLTGLLSPYYWNIELAMRYYLVKCGNIISISSYLHDYYRKRGCRSIRIPPTLDITEVTPSYIVSGPKISIAYTGTPGHKDLFNHYLEGILRVDSGGEILSLNIAGIAHEQILQYPAIKSRGYSSLPPCIKTLGRVDQATAMSLVRDSDFSVLLRPPERYAEAGFPTKVVESLSVGTPVIANITSDLGEYLHDEKEGVLCSDHSVESFIDALKRIKTFDKAKRLSMRKAARKQAESSFDYRHYSAIFSEFIKEVIN